MVIFKIWKANRKAFLYILVLLFFTLSFSSTLFYLAYEYESLIRTFSYIEWILLFMGISLTMAFALTPTTLIALLCGFFLGPSSIIGLILSYLLASLIGYLSAHFIDKGKFMDSLMNIPEVRGLMTRLQTKQFGLIILTRLSPVLPFAIMNVLLAILKIDLKRFLLGSIIGMLPRTLICIWVGMQFKHIRTLVEEGTEHSVLKISMALLIIVSILGLYMYINKIIKATHNQA